MFYKFLTGLSAKVSLMLLYVTIISYLHRTYRLSIMRLGDYCNDSRCCFGMFTLKKIFISPYSGSTAAIKTLVKKEMKQDIDLS